MWVLEHPVGERGGVGEAGSVGCICNALMMLYIGEPPVAGGCCLLNLIIKYIFLFLIFKNDNAVTIIVFVLTPVNRDYVLFTVQHVSA